MADKLTQLQLTQLNNLIKEYYGDVYSVFFVQGLFVSYLSWPTFGTPRELILGKNAVITAVKPSSNFSPDFDKLLFQGLFNETVRGCKTVNIVPMISLEQVKVKAFRYMLLDIEQQHNLLEWLFGYFLGFFMVWDQEKILTYIQNITEVLEQQHLWNILDTLHIVFSNLVIMLNYKAKTPLHKKIIKHVNATVVKLDEFSKLAYGMNGKVALCKIIGEALGNINHICMQSKVPAVN